MMVAGRSPLMSSTAWHPFPTPGGSRPDNSALSSPLGPSPSSSAAPASGVLPSSSGAGEVEEGAALPLLLPACAAGEASKAGA